MRIHTILRGVALAGATCATLCATVPSASAADATPARAQCFYMSQWSGWHAPNPTTMLIRVGISEIWRIDLHNACNMLRDPSAHLVTKVHGSDNICGPLDLDLSVQDTNGFTEPCFVKSIRKLSPDEVKAIARKDIP